MSGTGCCSPTRRTRAPTAADPVVAPGDGRPVGVIPVTGGPSFVGTDTPLIPTDGEGPERPVLLADYALEAACVTNARFAKFVETTGYVTEAERFGWSAVFDATPAALEEARSAGSQLPWWQNRKGACWRAPEGPGSSIADRMDHPVVQVSWSDAVAFATWVGGRLPSEAEWEHAARGGAVRKRFPWGDDEPNDETILCNIWQGSFPDLNSSADGYERTAPADGFPQNEAGFRSLVGNVWEWTGSDLRHPSSEPAARKRNAIAERDGEKVLKGGSFLCHASYCYRYRIAARMGLPPDSTSGNVGFRVAYDRRSAC